MPLNMTTFFAAFYSSTSATSWTSFRMSRRFARFTSSRFRIREFSWRQSCTSSIRLPTCAFSSLCRVPKCDWGVSLEYRSGTCTENHSRSSNILHRSWLCDCADTFTHESYPPVFIHKWLCIRTIIFPTSHSYIFRPHTPVLCTFSTPMHICT